MANVNSLTSSNSYSSANSIYGSRNVLTGLASGMDTETMIQNSVTGYQTKISELQQSQTKIEWKQDAYRDLTDQMNSIIQKYTSYSSKTNLSSNSFFMNATTTSANGVNASAVSVTGSTKSDVQINAVQKLATAARYSVDASDLDMKATGEAVGTGVAWGESLTKGTLSGTMTLRLGTSSIDIAFGEDDKYTSLQELAEGINQKLEAQNADVSATIKDGSIVFAATGDARAKGDSVYIRSVSGNLKSLMNVQTATSTVDEKRFSYTSFSLKGAASTLTATMDISEYLSGKTVDVTLDGVTKQIKLGDLKAKLPDLSSYDADIKEKKEAMDALSESDPSRASAVEAYEAAVQAKTDKLNTVMNTALKDDLQDSINKAFGKGKITVGLTDEGGLRFDAKENSGSTVKVSSTVGKMLGLGEAGVSNYFNTSQKLGDLVGEDWLNANARTQGTVDEDAPRRYFDKDGNELKLVDGAFFRTNSDGSIKTKNGEKVLGKLANTFRSDADGNLVKWDNGKYYRVNEKGDWLYALEMNGATIGGLTKDTALESVMNKINSSVDAGVNVSFSSLTSQFVFTARETGTGGDISFDNALAKKLFSSDNSPEAATVGKLFGDSIQWNNNKANLSIIGGVAGFIDLGEVRKDMTIKELMEKVNGSSDIYQNLIRYNEDTKTYSFNDLNNNAMGQEHLDSIKFIYNYSGGSFSEAGLADSFAKLSVGTRTAGEDAIIDVTVNGVNRTLTRSSNVVAMDGLSVTLKETFAAEKASDAITFTTSSDADTVVDTVKSFVEDVNKLMKDVHDAFATQPLKKSSGSTKRDGYEPLTEDDKKDMSESAIKAYEDKAKTGLLFGDTDLSQLYSKLLNAVQSFGADRADMKAIGLETSYSNGLTQLKLNESDLRSALDADPDKVRNVFAKTKDGGSATDGLMTTLKSTLNAYGSTSLGSPGILVSKAGSKLSAVSLMNNTLQKQIDNLNSQIEKWQSKLSDKIDYYTKQFTQMEKLMSTMNNQSSMLSDLMGY